MAIVTVNVRLPADPDPLSSPPDAVEEYPPYKLIFTSTDTHILTDPTDSDLISIASTTSRDRYLRVEATGLADGEVVENIKIWCEEVIPDDFPEDLRDLIGRHSSIITNCTMVSGDYYGSRMYQDAMYSKDYALGSERPEFANVGIDGSLVGQITNLSQPLEMLSNGGASDWILLQAMKTQELTDYISGNPALTGYTFLKNIYVEWDEY